MRICQLAWRAALAVLSLSTVVAQANCQLTQVGTLPVDMLGLRPFVWTKINGVSARFALDSGAFFSLIWRDAAMHDQLPITSVPGAGAYYIRGAGGRQRAMLATVKSFDFAGMSLSKTQFLVIDQMLGLDYVGVIGQNMLRFSDMEYDLANGTVRFFTAAGCEHRALAYWAVGTQFTTVDLQRLDTYQNHLVATAMINGKAVTVWFDTGASQSVLSLQAAARAGITPDGPGVTFLGLSGGFGPGLNKVWSTPVDSFELGGEKVQHTHLLISNIDPAHQVGEVGGTMPDMLLGDDFFLAHRIYVAYSQNKLYFTYNGGPLFNLNLPQVASGAPKPPASPAPTSQTSAATSAQPGEDAPTDADGFRRRGMAYAAMRQFDRALADLTRACELAPKDAETHYDRALVYLRSGQFKLSLQDLDTAITLQPDDTDSRLVRAHLLLSHPDAYPTAAPEIKSDLDTVARLAAPDANIHIQLGQLYGRLGDYPTAIDQIDQWLSHHSLPGDQIAGLNARCWSRAAANSDLQKALEDCNHALNMASDDLGLHDSRGLVYLRLGRLDDAIHDYDFAIHANPNLSTSLYGRGLAQLRLGEKAQGQADLAAAEKLDKGVAPFFAKMGLAP